MINEVMRDDYRWQVAKIALKHIPHASLPLLDHARQVLSQFVKVEGFRDGRVAHAPLVKSLAPVVERMQQHSRVMSTIIGLWAEAKNNLVCELRQLAEDSKLEFEPGWSWHDGISGFYSLEASPHLEKLSELVEVMSHDRQQIERDNIHLAAFWLSSAIIGSYHHDDSTSHSSDPNLNDTDFLPNLQLIKEIQDSKALQNEEEIPNISTIKGQDNDFAGPQSEHLEILAGHLEVAFNAALESYQQVVDCAGTLMGAINSSNLIKAETTYNNLGSIITEWNQRRKVVHEFLKKSEAVLKLAFQERPELKVDSGFLLSLNLDEQQELDSAVRYAFDMFGHVNTYDKNRSELLKELNVVQSSLIETTEKIQSWDSKIELIKPIYYDIAVLAESSLHEIQGLLSNSQKSLTENQKFLDRLDNDNRWRISKMIEELQDNKLRLKLLEQNDTKVIDNNYIAQLSIEKRKELEENLLQQLQQVTSMQSDVLKQLASELAVSWDDGILVNLLENLALQSLNIETLLLLIAANKEHPRIQTISLSSNIISSLVEGITTFAPGQEPQLVSLIASDLFNEWRYQDKLSKLNLYVLLVAAHVITYNKLPSGFLWTIEAEWPFDNMPNWVQLWKSIRDGLPVIIVDGNANIEVETKLFDAKKAALVAIKREPNGLFIRAQSLKDRKYKRVLNHHLLPFAELQLQKIQTIDGQIQSLGMLDTDSILAKIIKLTTEIELAKSDESIQVKFDEGLAAENLSNFHAFHGRTTISNYRDALEDVYHYVLALREFVISKNNSEVTISSTELRSELMLHSLIHPQAMQWIDEMTITRDKISQPPYTSKNATETFEYQLLSHAVHAQRLPHLIGSLTQRKFSWTMVLNFLLEDLVDPVHTASSCVDILLTKGATVQALLLAEHITGEQQKELISRNDDLKKQIEQLRLEYLKIGGEIDDVLQSDYQLGRWQLLKFSLKSQIDALREKEKQHHSDSEKHILVLFEQITLFELEIFKRRTELPEVSLANLQQSFTLARQALNSGTIEPVIEFVKGIQYRFEHESWDMDGVQRELSALHDALSLTNSNKRSALNSEQLLINLKNREFSQIGINAASFEDSKLDTRIEILEKWLQIQNRVSSFHGLSVAEKDKSIIRALYVYFARMMQMRYARTVNNDPQAYDDPVLYSVYELIYPRTTALNRFCTFVTLPGKAVNPDSLSLLNDLLDSRNWLDNGFVVLFLPGVSVHVVRRLHSQYFNRGLIAIDESTMVNFIVAESESLIPLGLLRSLMLNSKGAHNVDIFKVNQLVHHRTSIFVGRDSFVSKVASSGDNYVIYGGRRIGKSSVLQEIKRVLESSNVRVIDHSFEGDFDCSDNKTARRLARRLNINIDGVDGFKGAIQNHLDQNIGENIAIILDEIDAYIHSNPKRHVFIQALRALSDQYGDRFRVIAAGFMLLYAHIKGRGPYTPASDPWIRMFNDEHGPLPNLESGQAEKIVHVGFREILGWKFESHRIPQIIVEKTGGHPAFVQYFCMKLQRLVGKRQDQVIRLDDIDTVFNDQSPNESFIAHVKDTLGMNIRDPFGRYLLIHLAIYNGETRQFTYAQAKECADLFRPDVTSERLEKNLEQLIVTSVIREKAIKLYEFTVPDYPVILNLLDEQSHISELEQQIRNLKG